MKKSPNRKNNPGNTIETCKFLAIMGKGVLASLFFSFIAEAQYKAPQENWECLVADYWMMPGKGRIATNGAELYISGGNVISVYSLDGQELRSFGGTGSENGQFDGIYDLAAFGEELFVADYGNNRIQVVSSADGEFIRSWITSAKPQRIAVDNSTVYAAIGNEIHTYTHVGEPGVSWGKYGSLPGAFNTISGLAVNRTHVFVLDQLNIRIQKFSKSGVFDTEWPLAGLPTSDPSFQRYGNALAADDQCVYVGIGSIIPSTGWRFQPSIFRIYDTEGILKRHWGTTWDVPNANPLGNIPPIADIRGIAIASPFIYTVNTWNGIVLRFRQLFRTGGTLETANNAVPYGKVLTVQQRAGEPILDIDYIISDQDATTVSAYALAFTGTPFSLTTCIPIRNLQEGTDSNVGSAIPVATTRRLTWDTSTDWNPAAGYGDIRIAILAKDDRELLDLHFIHMPANLDKGLPALVINRVPILQNDLLNLWFWLIAFRHPNLNLANGEVRGVGGAYDGVLLASGDVTTDEGRAFLFAHLGYREATPGEIQRAKEADTPGIVTQWDPRYKLPDGRPSKINEFGFDTGSTIGWWVVKE